MSFIGDLIGGGNDYAAQAAQQEATRQKNITTGTTVINNAFAGFTPEFYQNYANAYGDFARPQVAQQYKQTKDAIGFDLANRGLSRSGTANSQWDNLATTMGQAQQGIVDTGIQQAQGLQNQVQQSENQELSNLYTSADPAQAASQATATAASFKTPSAFPAVANVFSTLLNQYYTNQLVNSYSQTNNTIAQLLSGQQPQEGL